MLLIGLWLPNKFGKYRPNMEEEPDRNKRGTSAPPRDMISLTTNRTPPFLVTARNIAVTTSTATTATSPLVSMMTWGNAWPRSPFADEEFFDELVDETVVDEFVWVVEMVALFSWVRPGRLRMPTGTTISPPI